MMSAKNLVTKLLNCINLNASRHLNISSQGFSSIAALSKSSVVFRNQRLHYLFSSSQNHIPVSFHTSFMSFDDNNPDLPVEDTSQPLVKLTFIKMDGTEVEIEGRVGLTVMQAAIKNDLPIEAACDGQLACTTCHVYVEDCIRKDSGTENPYLENRAVEEEDMLDSASFCKPNSRLSCQLIISPLCENARFRLPAATINFSVDKRKEEGKG